MRSTHEGAVAAALLLLSTLICRMLPDVILKVLPALVGQLLAAYGRFHAIRKHCVWNCCGAISHAISHGLRA